MNEVQRWDYTGTGLDEADLPAAPWAAAADWVEHARAHENLHEPTALAFATVDAEGRPDVRTVLMRFFTPAGPGFVSSRHSRKARDIEAAPRAAASLTWTPLFRAIRFRGVVAEIEKVQTAAYWATRPWGSRISAWASRQSHPAGSREELERRYAELAERWPDQGRGDDVPVPEDWVGYRLECDEVEFWAGRPDRLHDRFRYGREEVGPLDADGWRFQRLQP